MFKSMEAGAQLMGHKVANSTAKALVFAVQPQRKFYHLAVLASDDSPFITGQMIMVDGGSSFH
jgi:hypothetical protein